MITSLTDSTSYNMSQFSTNTEPYMNRSAVEPVNMTEILELLKTLYKTENCSTYCNGKTRRVLLEYKEIHGYISLVICIFGTIANILNIIVLTRKDMQKSPINIILKWLAVADMFVMIEYIPFAIYMYLIFPEQKDFSYIMAVYLLIHMHFSQILHTISILLTVTVAVWRYIAIQHPHGACAIIALSHVNEVVMCSFILSPILCFPTYFGFGIDHTTVVENNTEIVLYYVNPDMESALYNFNFWIHAIIIKLVPCFALTMISIVLVQVLCQATRRKMKLKGNCNLAPNKELLNSATPVKPRPPKTDRRADRTTALLVGVLFLFLITEFPQGILGLLSGILSKCFFIKCYTMFGEVMDLLALINSAIGFVLYGLMSKQFRTNFKEVFFKRSITTTENTRISDVRTTCV